MTQAALAVARDIIAGNSMDEFLLDDEDST